MLTDKIEVIEGIRQRDEQAFRLFVDQYKDYIFRICFSFVNDADDAQDITQEVFIKVFESINTFRSDSRMSTWLYRIAVNLSLNYLRSRKKFNLFERLEKVLNPDSILHQTDVNEVDENMEDKRIKLLYEAMERIPEKQKSAFIMHNLEHLSYKEIADVMDISLSAVESLIHRAKKNTSKYIQRKLKNKI